MNKEQKIALIRSIISVWGEFRPSQLEDDYDIVVGSMGNLIALIDNVGDTSVDVSVYGSSSSSVDDYTLEYSEVTDSVLDELVLLCKRYNDLMLEEAEQE